jgi:REP element-mobilizing transposase RayT
MPATEAITRRNLPHWYVPGASYFVTFRLAGSLPVSALETLAQRKKLLLNQRRPAGMTMCEHRTRIHKILFADYDRSLDECQDVCWLKQSELAEVVRRSLYHFNGERYHLMSYCVMPNHVHVLFSPKDPAGEIEPSEDLPVGEQSNRLSPLASILHSWKSFTAHEANKIVRRSGPFWQRESYDHWVRDDEELERIVDYIAANPVKAGLAERPIDFRYCSAYDRFAKDGETSGWLLE